MLPPYPHMLKLFKASFALVDAVKLIANDAYIYLFNFNFNNDWIRWLVEVACLSHVALFVLLHVPWDTACTAAIILRAATAVPFN